MQDLISLLEGKHLGLRRAAEEKLREIAENDDSLTLRKTAGNTLISLGIKLEQPIETLKENLSTAKPLPVEIPKKEQREDKKIGKPAPIAAPPLGEGRVRERTPPTLPNWKSIASNSNFRLIGGIAGGLLIIGFLIWGASKLLQNSPNTTPEATDTSQSFTTINTSQSEQTNTPSPTQTSILPTPTLGIGSTMISDKDGMTLLYIPAGEFTMGSNNGEADEKPVHTVYLDAFWIDKTEVTNAMYAKCVQGGNCNQPSNTTYHNDSNYANHPVVYVSWNDAKAYCEWAGRRLPTEAEWEKAARGEDAFIYPWGNDSPNNSLLNYNDTIGETTEVGKYPSGASPYGARDMAGNVWEWVADWYSDTYYASSLAPNPLGPDSGQYRVLRGGSWLNVDLFVRSALRNWSDPTLTGFNIGFRCSRSP